MGDWVCFCWAWVYFPYYFDFCCEFDCFAIALACRFDFAEVVLYLFGWSV